MVCYRPETDPVFQMGHMARVGETRGSYTFWVGKREEERPLGIRRRRWEYNIKVNIEVVWEGVDWIVVAQDRDKWRALVNAVKNLRFP
jgi:hypothetical protein